MIKFNKDVLKITRCYTYELNKKKGTDLIYRIIYELSLQGNLSSVDAKDIYKYTIKFLNEPYSERTIIENTNRVKNELLNGLVVQYYDRFGNLTKTLRKIKGEICMKDYLY
jgi:hypothetical protein